MYVYRCTPYTEHCGFPPYRLNNDSQHCKHAPHSLSTHLAASSSSSPGPGDTRCHCLGAVLSGVDQRRLSNLQPHTHKHTFDRRAHTEQVLPLLATNPLPNRPCTILLYIYICICLLPQSGLNCNLQMHFPRGHIFAILLVPVGIRMLYSRTVQQRLSGVVILNNTCKHCLTATSQINQQRTGNNIHTCTVHSDMHTHKQHTIQMKSVLLVLQ